MNNDNLTKEFLYQAFALLISVILVHALYVSVIRPEATEIIQAQQLMIAQDINYIPERSLYVIISNFEQEACFILMFWAFAVMFLKGRTAINERRLLQKDLIPLQLGNVITPSDTEDFLKRLDKMPETDKDLLLPRILSNGLKRFSTTGNVQDVSISTHTMVETEADRLESELSMMRYIAWAIPSIGFIGTVRGIGSALSLAHRAVDGDISGVTQNLGVAFNSTFVALVVSIFLMFLLHQLQLLQDRLVLDCQNYCDESLIRHLQVPEKDS